jgi:hypothetical protein
MTMLLRTIGIAGMLLFGLALALTFVSPIHVERAAGGFVTAKLQQQVRDRVEIAGDERIASIARRLQQQRQAEIDSLREQLLSGLNARVVAAVARMQDVDCDCRMRMHDGLEAAGRLQIARLERAEPQLRRLIEGGYGGIVADLLRDLRLFTGINLLAFALLVLLSSLRPQYVRQLFVPGLLLAAASLAASGLYLFGQNWFFTLLYNDYVGATYAVWLLLIYGLLCDVALFRARVTSWVLEAVASVFGKVAASAPC